MELCIKSRREARGMNQTELAKAAGVSRQTIVNLENGTVTAMSKTLIKIAESLDCTLDDLFAR